MRGIRFVVKSGIESDNTRRRVDGKEIAGIATRGEGVGEGGVGIAISSLGCDTCNGTAWCIFSQGIGSCIAIIEGWVKLIHIRDIDGDGLAGAIGVAGIGCLHNNQIAVVAATISRRLIIGAADEFQLTSTGINCKEIFVGSTTDAPWHASVSSHRVNALIAFSNWGATRWIACISVGSCDPGLDCVNVDGDRIVGIRAISVAVVLGIWELATINRDHSIGCAVGCWREGGCVGGSRSGEAGEGSSRNLDIWFNEICWGLRECEGDSGCITNGEWCLIWWNCNGGPNGVNADWEGIVGIRAISVAITTGIWEFATINGDHPIGRAVGCWREGGCVRGSRSREAGEGSSRNLDIWFSEISCGLRECEGDGRCFTYSDTGGTCSYGNGWSRYLSDCDRQWLPIFNTI